MIQDEIYPWRNSQIKIFESSIHVHTYIGSLEDWKRSGIRCSIACKLQHTITGLVSKEAS